MKITALVENTFCRENILAEHGLSLYIETANHKILFDAGQSKAFARNAETLGVNLNKVDLAVLSHGHYDHGGGLKPFLELNKTAPIYLNQYAFEPHYHGAEKYIGLDPKLLPNERFYFIKDSLVLEQGLYLSCCERLPLVEQIDSGGLNVLENGKLVPEDFRHEQYLLVQEKSKKILFSGCSHKGILNIMEWFHPDILVGGFHLKKLDSEQDREKLLDIAKRLQQYPTQYYTCHCTGVPQYQLMKTIMGNQLHYLGGGETIIL